ncbi:phosphatase PAP2 family protein [Thermoleophilia bacterium SCSIO 60948]|nr:phosphatase PAP2 family protein [Thermoleophilia bacterium SCSIO 60948]
MARPGLIEDAERIDLAVYAAIARTPTPTLDRALARLSRAADHSRVHVAIAAGLALTGGRSGRLAAASGLGCTMATSAVVNLGLKPLGARRRPDREASESPVARHVRMPESTSFPSGHSASAFAFASGVGQVQPLTALPLHGLSTLIAYSRVHTGVHYPADAVAGAVIGGAVAQLVGSVGRRWSAARRRG